jgi:Ca-activated chloride channel homolog
VSFANPTFLLALLLVPAALAAQVASRRRARRYAVRFPALTTLKLAAGTTPAWRRHLPAGLLLGALALLSLALAKPQKDVAVPIRRASIMLVTDHSRSMMATDVNPDRLTAAKRAAQQFIDKLPRGIRVGVTTFAEAPDGTQTPSTDHELVRRMIDAQIADGGTATGDALQVALGALQHEPKGLDGKRPPSAVVLLSDGATTAGSNPVAVAEQAGQMKIPIYTVALGTRDATVPNPGFGPPRLSVAPDPETLRQIAEASGGRAFTAEDDQQLSSVYQTLGSQLGTRTTKREVTAAFAIGGLVLLLGAAAASSRWAGRLP